jgi:hypothetical protein
MKVYALLTQMIPIHDLHVKSTCGERSAIERIGTGGDDDCFLVDARVNVMHDLSMGFPLRYFLSPTQLHLVCRHCDYFGTLHEPTFAAGIRAPALDLMLDCKV